MKPEGTQFTKHPCSSALAWCALCLGVLYPAGVRGDSLATNLTLEAALDYGGKNNPQLQAAYHQWQGAVYNIAVQKALPDPMLTYGYYFESVETKAGPQEQSFGLSQKIPAFGKLSAMKAIASDLADEARQRYQREKLNLGFSIAKAYAELYYHQRSIGIMLDRINLITDLEEVARTRYKTGSPMAPILQAQVELGRLEDNLKSLNDLQRPLEARLNALLNRPSDTPLPAASTLPYLAVNTDTVNLPRTSPELMELQAKVEQGNHQLLLARRQRWPDFTLGVMYIDTGAASGSVPASGKDPVIGTVGISLPIWFGKNHARIESAASLKTAAELSLANRQDSLNAEIQQALFDLRDADRKLNLYQDSLIPKASQSLEVNRQGYEAGSMEFINLIDAERTLLEFELAYERARADHLIARAKLSQLTGIDYLSGMEKHEDTKDPKN